MAGQRWLIEAGIGFDGPPTDMPWGARHAWLRDPSGYRLSIAFWSWIDRARHRLT